MSVGDGRTVAGRVEISVVIPAFDAAATLDGAFESLQVQDDVAWEALVVDDGSRDATGELARAWSARDPRIRVLTHEGGVNRGVAASRNLGVGAARGAVVAFLDADDVLLPGALRDCVEVLRAFPGAAVAYGLGERAGGPGGAAVIGRGLPATPARLFEQLCRFNVMVTSAVAARREALGRKPFPTGLPFQFEDWACWLELARREAFVFVPRVWCRYRTSPSSAMARVEAARLLPRFEIAQAAFLRSLSPGAGRSDRGAIREGLLFRAAEALRRAFPGLRRGRWGEARPWLDAWRRIAGSPVLAVLALGRAAAAHRRARAGVEPPLSIRPWPDAAPKGRSARG